MTSSTDILLCIGYFVVWILTFIWYHIKRPQLDAGSVIIGMQVVYAFFSILTISDALFSYAFNELKLFPYIYLYSMLMVALLPVIRFHIHPAQSIRGGSSRILVLTSLVLFLTAVLQIPDMMSEASTGLAKLITESDAGKEAYEETADSMSQAGSKIRNVPAFLFNMLSDLIPFLLFYFMSLKKKNRILILCLFVAMLINILLPVTRGQRNGTVQGILTVVAAFFMFRAYISQKARRIIQTVGFTVILLFSVPVIAITMSRFGEKAAGAAGYVNWYVGQGSLYFNNYGLDAGGTRNGDRTAYMIKRLIDPSTPKNYVERRDKYPNLYIDDYFFVTFVGDFTIDFGPYLATLIIIAFGLIIMSRIRIRDGSIALYDFMLLYFAICVSIQGGMTLFSYSDTGNLRIVAFLMLYAYLRYHERLLGKFGKADTPQEQT